MVPVGGIIADAMQDQSMELLAYMSSTFRSLKSRFFTRSVLTLGSCKVTLSLLLEPNTHRDSMGQCLHLSQGLASVSVYSCLCLETVSNACVHGHGCRHWMVAVCYFGRIPTVQAICLQLGSRDKRRYLCKSGGSLHRRWCHQPLHRPNGVMSPNP